MFNIKDRPYNTLFRKAMPQQIVLNSPNSIESSETSVIKISCNAAVTMVKKVIMVSQEHQEGYSLYDVGCEHPKHGKYFICLFCGCGLPKIRIGVTEFL